MPAIAGFRKAVELAFNNFEKNVEHMRMLRDALIRGIEEKVPNVILNGPRGNGRAPDNVNISFLRVEGEALTVETQPQEHLRIQRQRVYERILEPGHVLLAIGRKYEEAHGSIINEGC